MNSSSMGLPPRLTLAAPQALPYPSAMTAAEVIREIEALPPEEQAEVVRFARRLGARRKLSPEELGSLAERLAATDGPFEATVLREELVEGFYGDKANA